MPPPWARWLIPKLQRARADELKGLVRSMDKELNNTSVILLFEIGDVALLFPGDAQIESWAYALRKESIRKRLASVELYKVGHHGSLSATPKSLWNLFANRSTAPGDRRLRSVMSTLPNRHGAKRIGQRGSAARAAQGTAARDSRKTDEHPLVAKWKTDQAY